MFWNAFVNVLAIIAIIVVAAFVMIFLGDLLISIIDGKSGIFFKRNKKAKVEELEDEDDKSNYATREELAKLQEMYRNKETQSAPVVVVQPQPVQKNVTDDYLNNAVPVDYDLAKKEEEIMNAKKNRLLVPKEEEKVESGITKDEILDQVDKVADDILSNYEAEKTNKQKIDDYAKELENYKIETSLDDVNEEELNANTDNSNNNNNDNNDNDDNGDDDGAILEPAPAPEKIVEKEVVKEVMVDNPEIVEENKKLQQQLEELRNALQEANNRASELEQEHEEEKDAGPMIYTTVEDCEARLEILEERLRVAKKELKINDKEFKPLFKVRKNLNKYKEKLRRKEVSVARQKVVLYGVNNYVDIDKDRAEKLANDIELLDGLRLSVQDCENVVEASKDRYPILEQTNRLLKTNIADLEHDIETTTQVLEALKADALVDLNDNGIDDRTEDNDDDKNNK